MKIKNCEKITRVPYNITSDLPASGRFMHAPNYFCGSAQTKGTKNRVSEQVIFIFLSSQKLEIFFCVKIKNVLTVFPNILQSC